MGSKNSSGSSVSLLKYLEHLSGDGKAIGVLTSGGDAQESPPEEDWEESLCLKLSENHAHKKRLNIVIVAEGAIDSQNQPISYEKIKELVVNQLGFDTRVPYDKIPKSNCNVAGINVGAPAAGMNAAVCAAVRVRIADSHRMFAIGFDGFAKGQVKEITWGDVGGWTGQGGSIPGTKSTLPGKYLEKIAEQIRSYSINALLIIGGFEAYLGLLELAAAQEKQRHSVFLWLWFLLLFPTMCRVPISALGQTRL
ncbi:6-phosphofructokinase type C-like protein [Cricetulus griseus]|nr:6-phosphofructokinase type C-like protein [Cricetulus griseus]